MSVDEVMPAEAPDAPPDLTRLFDPRGIAVIGASPGRARIGAQALMALRVGGFAGGIYPVNTKYEAIEDLPCYGSVADLPGPCDIAVICISGRHVPQTLMECGQAGISFAVVFSSGFDEIGEAGMEAQRALEDAIRRSGVRVLGPNCQGVMSLGTRAMCGFGAIFLKPGLQPGPVAMVSQSGGFGFGVLGHAQFAGIGFSHMVSTGNEVDLTSLDFLEYLIEQDEVKVLATYLEGVRDGRRLRRLGARALELGKPVLVWKVGNSREGRQAAASHTGNITSDYEFYRTAFAEGAFIEIHEIDDLIDIARAFGTGQLPAGNRTAIITVSGGAGVLFADRCAAHGIELGTLSAASREALEAFLPEYASLRNPFDLTAQVLNDAAHFNRAVEIVAGDPGIDFVLMRAAQSLARGEQLQALADIAARSGKPVLVAWGAPPDRDTPELRAMEALGMPWFSTPGRATFAAAALVEFARRLAERRPPAPETSAAAPALPAAIRPGEVLDEFRAKRVLREAGVPVVPEVLLDPAQIEALDDLPFTPPLVLKIASPDIHHKTEAGGVKLGIDTLAALKQAAREMLPAVSAHAPAARIEGLLVQRQATGTEVIVGVRNDPHFGPLVMVGLGGVLVELIRDVSYRYAPLTRIEAANMLAELRSYPLLTGYRGRAAADVDALIDAIVAISAFADAARDRIAEIDVNPILVGPAGAGVCVADALIVLSDGEKAAMERSRAHG